MADKSPDAVIVSAAYDKTSSFGKGSDKGPEKILDCLNTQVEFYERCTGTSPSLERDMQYCSTPGLRGLAPKKMIADDMRNDDSDYHPENFSRYAHSCVMRRGFEDYNLATVSIGIRAYSKAEYEFWKKAKLPVFEWPQKENKATITRILKSIKTKDVYISLDVDGIDPAYMPATGTPVQGGLSWHFTMDLLKAVFARKRVIAADIVEVAPREGDSLTEFGAGLILYEMLGLKFAKGKLRK